MVTPLLRCLATAALALWTVPAAAQALCGERAEMLRTLSKSYDEAQTAIGTTDDGNVVEVFASPSGSWTILVSLPDGRSCVVGTGENWQVLGTKLSGRLT